MTSTAADLPMLLLEVEARSVERLSPSFVRVELGASELAEFGVDGPLYDQRIKLVFPDAPDGPVPSFAGADESWYSTWLARPVAERGHMRTYTVRGVRGEGADTRLVVDFVVHEGATGPGGGWGERVRVGDRVAALTPKRGHVYGGIEFAPGDARRLLLVGDETAVPAIASILELLPPDAVGSVFVEVPFRADVLTLQHPEGFTVRWLPREGTPRGEALHAAVLEHLGSPEAVATAAATTDDDVDPDLWETPEYSSSGAAGTARSVGHDWDGLYAWIAGESKVVTGLRRALVNDLGVDRGQVAFMGYWRDGVAMRS